MRKTNNLQSWLSKWYLPNSANCTNWDSRSTYSRLNTNFIMYELYILKLFNLPKLEFVFACELSHFSRVHLFETLWTIGCQASLAMRILQARTLEWVPMPSSRECSQLRDRTLIPFVSCTGRWVLYHQHHLGSPKRVYPLLCKVGIILLTS